ncbi:hypothetical protein [Vibrio cyclitrophicus]|uniref:hypothetical protein n=1 Tax=Vibrio cyclitrophicus TaxID=47951 RepID=UPI0032E41593
MDNAYYKGSFKKVMNLTGTLAFGIIVVGSFIPAFSFDMFGIQKTISAIDYYGSPIVALMTLGAIACYIGLPLLITKGIGTISLIWLYYNAYQVFFELHTLIQIFGGTDSGPGYRQTIDLAVKSMGFGLVLILFGIIVLNFFMLKNYRTDYRYKGMSLRIEKYTDSLAVMAVKTKRFFQSQFTSIHQMISNESKAKPSKSTSTSHQKRNA